MEMAPLANLLTYDADVTFCSIFLKIRSNKFLAIIIRWIAIKYKPR